MFPGWHRSIFPQGPMRNSQKGSGELREGRRLAENAEQWTKGADEHTSPVHGTANADHGMAVCSTARRARASRSEGARPRGAMVKGTREKPELGGRHRPLTSASGQRSPAGCRRTTGTCRPRAAPGSRSSAAARRAPEAGLPTMRRKRHGGSRHATETPARNSPPRVTDRCGQL